ncbi:MraY family glycosyltransferase [Flammeovirgaceae bacterium SG7u.132]|nr:MraY family glycosyltransferase [Flammeovirgaceae bacterium SG7u.132]
MPDIISSFITAFMLSFMLLPLVIKVFKWKNIVDTPGGRKIHKGQIPSMGGIAIFFGFLMAVVMWRPIEVFGNFQYFFASLVIIFILGLRDDLIPLKAYHKPLGQLFAAFMVVYLNDIRLNSLYGLFGIVHVPDLLAYAISIFTIIVITNSFNLIDGLDGLASTLAVITLTAYGAWFYLTGHSLLSLMIFSLSGSIIGFINFNWSPAKIFMGDTGSLLIGFFLASISLYFIDVNYNLPGSYPLKFEAGIGTAVCVMMMPIFDTTRIMISRKIRGKSPFSPDKTHIHHLVMRLGLNHANTALIMGGINVVFIIMAVALKNYGEWIVIPAAIALAFGFSFVLDYFLKVKFPKKKSLRAQISDMSKKGKDEDSSDFSDDDAEDERA